ncbi:MAG: hypothetical protein AAF151_05190 [Cyanobacteria bacterium J06656_5]
MLWRSSRWDGRVSMAARLAGKLMKKRIKADRVSVVVAIATLTLVATVALASPIFFSP